ncbi:MAG: hypothetical protein HC796_06035 [Synechococcaceae cyanobacterium RL_1_2]|nr:hypothetical protein [Synechococcaceae cyanobacterium RL_1_2]
MLDIDIFVVYKKTAIVLEVKSNLTQNKVAEFLEKRPKFKAAFAIDKDYKIYETITGIDVDAQSASYAHKQGLFVIVQAVDMVKFANDEQFQPKSW